MAKRGSQGKRRIVPLGELRAEIGAMVSAEVLVDTGPAERYQHGDAVSIEGDETPHMRIHTQTMLDRYLNRRQIDARQFNAGRRVYRQWRASGGEPRVVANFFGTGGGGEMTDDQAELRVAFTRAIRGIGAQLSGVVVHVCLIDGSAAEWAISRMLPRSDGIARLRAGLDALADHYGLPRGGAKEN